MHWIAGRVAVTICSWLITRKRSRSNLSPQKSFKPPLHLRNAHLQTVLNSQGPRRLRARRVLQKLATEALIIEAEDGTRLVAELDRAADSRSRLVILIHGWEGCSTSAYMVTTAARLLERGFDVLRINLRDHGNSHHLNRDLFNSTRSPEVASALANYLAVNPWERVFIAGFSLGGSFALRIAADAGTELGCRAAIAVCPPIDPARAMDALNRGWFVYERYFFRRWRDSLKLKLELFPEFDYGDLLASARSLDDLNRLFIPRYTPWSEVGDYFAAYALVGDRLADLAMPAYLISSRDDPIIPVDDLQRIDPSENLVLETCRHGGHCAFLQSLGARSWVESRIVEILEQAP